MPSLTCCSAFDPVVAFNGMALFPISAQLIANTNITHNPTTTAPSILFIRNLLGEKSAYIHPTWQLPWWMPEEGALAFQTHPISFEYAGPMGRSTSKIPQSETKQEMASFCRWRRKSIFALPQPACPFPWLSFEYQSVG